MNKLTWIPFAAAVLLTGCAYNSENLDPTLQGFFPDDAAHKPAQFADVQAAAGARNDAMLQKFHFDGPRLNSLGEEKLGQMLKDDDAPAPVHVYLNVDEKGAFAKSRQDAVVAYLKDQGLKADQIKVDFGDNPDTHSPAAHHMANMTKLEGAPTSGPGTPSGAAPAGGGPGTDATAGAK